MGIKEKKEMSAKIKSEPMAIAASLMLKRIGPENFIDLAVKNSFEILPKEAALPENFPSPDGSLPGTIQSVTALKAAGKLRIVELAKTDAFEIVIINAALLLRNLTGTVAIDEDLWSESLKHQQGQRK